MGYRKVPLVTGCFYHVFNRSIAGFEIFRNREEFFRMREALRFYRTALPRHGFAPCAKNDSLWDAEHHGPARVRVVAYCLMPTHFHLFLEQKARGGVSDYMRFAEHSYGAYFNKKSGRLGPLWESRFKYKLVETDTYARHLARYIHLNPSSAGLVETPGQWEFSSYAEHLGQVRGTALCEYKDLMDGSPSAVRKFTEDHTDSQRSLQLLKTLLFD